MGGLAPTPDSLLGPTFQPMCLLYLFRVTCRTSEKEHCSVFFNFNLRVYSRHCRAKPDERQ